MTYETETNFGDRTTHRVKIYFHRHLKGMRNVLTRRLGHPDSSDTLACCWQVFPEQGSDYIAEIHYALDELDIDTIAHEAAHACLHRMRLIGAKDPEWNEEETATCIGILTEYAFRAWQKVKRMEEKAKNGKATKVKFNA